MRYRLLPWILQQEGTDFQRIEQRWRPIDLLYVHQARTLLSDIRTRYEQLSAAQDELQTLDRADLLVKLLTRMRMFVRQAGFVWRADHLAFIRAVSGFYSDYAAVLRVLKNEQERGRFEDPTPTSVVPSDRVAPKPKPPQIAKPRVDSRPESKPRLAPRPQNMSENRKNL